MLEHYLLPVKILMYIFCVIIMEKIHASQMSIVKRIKIIIRNEMSAVLVILGDLIFVMGACGMYRAVWCAITSDP